ncbi:serine/threonine protein kinase [Salpingoeca rosetta]|uniref:Serine/threonine protein kinase n=1 Tax=Salpingoeca rosetta (strain ATCC 50818 / BSB-021) TaxID=946362 RepID=F2UCB5_SALR5|nr:serine/threonine protein kinase [Salpingoeca rosetta]EGD74222.1 serine/threonine protein kinase [Salpingoeca rosetta]|eukprot:XP_004993122.1 serine/threonine protein kinase [Salpingoeca rosetta]
MDSMCLDQHFIRQVSQDVVKLLPTRSAPSTSSEIQQRLGLDMHNNNAPSWVASSASSSLKRHERKEKQQQCAGSASPLYEEVSHKHFKVTTALARHLYQRIHSSDEGWSTFAVPDPESRLQLRFQKYLQRYLSERALSSKLTMLCQVPFEHATSIRADMAVTLTDIHDDHFFFPFLIEFKRNGSEANVKAATAQVSEYAVHAVRCVPRFREQLVGLPFPFAMTVCGSSVDVFTFVLGHKQPSCGRRFPKLYRVKLFSDAQVQRVPVILDVLLSPAWLAYFAELYTTAFRHHARKPVPALHLAWPQQQQEQESEEQDVAAVVEEFALSSIGLEESPWTPQEPRAWSTHTQTVSLAADGPEQQQTAIERHRAVVNFETFAGDVVRWNDAVLKRISSTAAEQVVKMWNLVHPDIDVSILDIDQRTCFLRTPYLGTPTIHTDGHLRCAVEQLLRLFFAGYVHGDVRAENIVVNNKSEAFVIDFGLSTKCDTIAPGGYNTWLVERHPDMFGEVIALHRPEHDLYSLAMALARNRSASAANAFFHWFALARSIILRVLREKQQLLENKGRQQEQHFGEDHAGQQQLQLVGHLIAAMETATIVH